jgi:hypothetical protein
MDDCASSELCCEVVWGCAVEAGTEPAGTLLGILAGQEQTWCMALKQPLMTSLMLTSFC